MKGILDDALSGLLLLRKGIERWGGVVAQAKGYVWTRRRWLGVVRGGGGGRAAAAVGGGRIMVCDYCGVRCNVDK